MKIVFLFLLSIGCWSLSAQPLIENFTLTNAVDGSAVSLDNYADYSGVAIIFTSNRCPYDGYYYSRINGLITGYQGKIQFLLINSNLEPDESIENMKSAIDRGTPSVPYLADKEQVAMDRLGAKKNPEVFLLTGVKGKYTIVYSGAVDDNPQLANAVGQQYLRAAIDKLLAGQPVDILTIRPIGCTIHRK